MNIDQRGFEIGPFDIFGITLHPTFHWYGLIIVAGIALAALLAAWMAKRDDKDPDVVWDALIWVVILGVVFARAWHVLFPSISMVESGRDTGWYLSHFFDLNEGPLVIWSGGLSIFGAVIGGVLGVLLYTWRHKLDILSWLDIGAVAVPLGQAIGRWGNYVNQELYGKPTDLPWGIKIDNPPLEYSEATRFHPLFLYESLWNLLTVGVLLTVWLKFRHRLKQGDILLMYLVMYPTVRALLEFLRIEVAMSGGINVSQVFSALVAVVAALALIVRHRHNIARRLRGDAPAETPAPAPKNS
ncbi:prolipoprotein diacylglyceryl transferase [Aggregatilinea lenta]|uniref:prolipoprotein diacylglyceryl transferase n=1 Tax=Aggregatilinea lenta TaxID=913108 RepID=UPI000E5B79CB|nr:prolipoprotein diacylglyceryl transferase [Aggregatilinea lenta]